MSNRITKKDIEDIRGLMSLHKNMNGVVSRLEKKLKVDITHPSEWEELLDGLPLDSDEDVVFALGVVSARPF